MIIVNLQVVRGPLPGGKIGNPESVEKVAGGSGSGYDSGSGYSAPPPTNGNVNANANANAFAGGGGSGPVVKADPNMRTMPVKALNPYMNRWTIKVR